MTYTGIQGYLVRVEDGPLAEGSLSQERRDEIQGSLTGAAVYGSVTGDFPLPFQVMITIALPPGIPEERYERIQRIVADAMQSIADGVEASDAVPH